MKWKCFFFWHVKKVFPMDLVPLAGEGRKDIRTFKKNLRFVFFFFWHNIFCLKSRWQVRPEEISDPSPN